MRALALDFGEAAQSLMNAFTASFARLGFSESIRGCGTRRLELERPVNVFTTARAAS